MPKEERQLAAIMFTDIVGYSAMAQRDETLALELLEEHRCMCPGNSTVNPCQVPIRHFSPCECGSSYQLNRSRRLPRGSDRPRSERHVASPR